MVFRLAYHIISRLGPTVFHTPFLLRALRITAWPECVETLDEELFVVKSVKNLVEKVECFKKKNYHFGFIIFLKEPES